VISAPATAGAGSYPIAIATSKGVVRRLGVELGRRPL